MADFERSWRFLKQWEGGFVNNPADPGGATNHGISLRWYRRAIDSAADDDTIRNLTEEAAKNLVYNYWWEGRLFYAIQSQDVANRYFGFVFNMGPRNGTRILQRAINAVEDAPTKVVIDGVLGPNTVAAANAIYPPKLLAKIREQAWAFYERLIKNRPMLKRFERGWRRRAEA